MNINKKIEELNNIMAEIENCKVKENNMSISSVDNKEVKEYKNKKTWGLYNIVLRLAGCGILSGLAYFLVNIADPIAKFFEYIPFWYIGTTALLFMYFSHEKSKESQENKYNEILNKYSVEQESIKLLMNYNMKFTELNNEIKLITDEDEPTNVLEEFKSTLKASLRISDGKLKIERFNRYVKSICQRHSELADYDIRERSNEIVDTIENELKIKNKSDLNKERVSDKNTGILENAFSDEKKSFELSSNKELSASVKHLRKEDRLAHANKIVEQPIDSNINEVIQIRLSKQKEYINEK